MLMGALIVAASISQVFADVAAVNINTASAEALASALNGVGIAKAYRIVEYREAHGPFEAVDELSEVKGIGDALVTRNRDLIVLQ
jgi:competence protein ComEA